MHAVSHLGWSEWLVGGGLVALIVTLNVYVRRHLPMTARDRASLAAAVQAW